MKTILLPNIEGDFDHFGIDLKGNRLFLTAEDHHSVEVFNLKSNTRVHSIGGLGEPHNVRYLPDRNKLVVVDGGVFSSNAHKNPTLPIMALAWRSMDHLADRMRKGEV